MEKSHAKHLDFQQLIILDLAVQQLYLVFLVCYKVTMAHELVLKAKH